MEFFAEDAVLDPLLVYQKLSRTSPESFFCLYKLEDKWLICASPERFLKKEGNKNFIASRSKELLQDF
jgi:para-aminobenzoate synthetase component 1